MASSSTSSIRAIDAVAVFAVIALGIDHRIAVFFFALAEADAVHGGQGLYSLEAFAAVLRVHDHGAAGDPDVALLPEHRHRFSRICHHLSRGFESHAAVPGHVEQPVTGGIEHLRVHPIGGNFGVKAQSFHIVPRLSEVSGHIGLSGNAVGHPDRGAAVCGHCHLSAGGGVGLVLYGFPCGTAVLREIYMAHLSQVPF